MVALIILLRFCHICCRELMSELQYAKRTSSKLRQRSVSTSKRSVWSGSGVKSQNAEFANKNSVETLQTDMGDP